MIRGTSAATVFYVDDVAFLSMSWPSLERTPSAIYFITSEISFII